MDRIVSFSGIPLAVAVFLLAFSGMCSGCKKSDTKPASDTSSPVANEVWIQNNAFTPVTITVAVNTTVKWTNKDGIQHTVTSTTGLFDSGAIGNGGTYSHQFTVAGSYPYKCSFHSSMTGTVIVQ